MRNLLGSLWFLFRIATTYVRTRGVIEQSFAEGQGGRGLLYARAFHLMSYQIHGHSRLVLGNLDQGPCALVIT